MCWLREVVTTAIAITVSCVALNSFADDKQRTVRIEPAADGLLATEKLGGEGVWVDPLFDVQNKRVQKIQLAVWFDEQFLGDGAAYQRRAKELADSRRRELRIGVMKTLKALSDRSYEAAEGDLDKLIEGDTIADFERHWIINGFSCSIAPEGLDKLKAVKGVKKIFVAHRGGGGAARRRGESTVFEQVKRQEFDPSRYKHPWYIRYLQADKVWRDFGVTGEGTLNVVHDFNFVYSDNVSYNLYRNPNETPGNEKDDDGNGLVDDYHGFNFDRGSAVLTTVPLPAKAVQPQAMHGYMCAAIICGSGVEGKPYEFGIAPEGKWTGVIAATKLEAAIEWAIEQGADTYSMSFSIPGLAEYRSHWRKVMEHGSMCGIYFVSGAGNFAQNQPVPVQMRTPEDIPEVVFAAAGVQRNFSRTPFSSTGPVKWQTEHYQDGMVQKPEVCAFNMGLPLLLRDGNALPVGLNGNSFAGPMFCGSIALMVSADPDLLPWDLKTIITKTATDVAAKGTDDETGHGLINCYRAVKEVMRRKAVREGKDSKKYEGREDGDEVDIAALKKKLGATRLAVGRVQSGGQAAKSGIKVGDVVISYNGIKITKQQDMQAAKRKATEAKLESIPMVIERNGESIELKLKPGPLGIFPVVEYDDPTFK